MQIVNATDETIEVEPGEALVCEVEEHSVGTPSGGRVAYRIVVDDDSPMTADPDDLPTGIEVLEGDF